MKNRNKTLTSLAAASMVLTQAGQMSVFAKEGPMKNLSDTEEVSVEKTQKELLEEQIKNTLDNVNEAKKEFDEAQEKYETYKKSFCKDQFDFGDTRHTARRRISRHRVGHDEGAGIIR